MQFLIMAAGAALVMLGLWVFKASAGAIHEVTAAVLVAGGVVAFAIGILIQTVMELRADQQAADTRRKAEHGEFDQSWRKS